MDIHEEAVVQRSGTGAAVAGDVHPGAFCGQKMKEAVIPASFQWFGGSEFRDCKQLASVVFLDISSPVHWGDSGMVFASCSMASLTLPPMFADYDVAANFITSCKKLKLVALGEGTDQLLSTTISNCAALEKSILTPVPDRDCGGCYRLYPPS